MKNKYGTYKVTKKGLVKEEEKPIKMKFADGTKTTIYPDHPFYSVVDYYGRRGL